MDCKSLKHLRCTQLSYREIVKTYLSYSSSKSSYSIFSSTLACFLLVLLILKVTKNEVETLNLMRKRIYNQKSIWYYYTWKYAQ